MFPLSPVGTAPQKTQLPWDAPQPYKGLGFRSVHAGAGPRPTESFSVRAADCRSARRLAALIAARPAATSRPPAGEARAPTLALKAGNTNSAQPRSACKGARLTFVLTTPDFVHGFSVPDFGVRIDLVPGKTVELTFTPDSAGRFTFLCDNFCGDAHDRMTGTLIVTDA